MKTKLFIVVVFIFGFFLDGCKDPCGKTNYPLSSELRDLYFKKGTYWIYQDSATLEMDSQYVYQDTFYRISSDYRTTTNSGRVIECNHHFESYYYSLTSHQNGTITFIHYGAGSDDFANSAESLVIVGAGNYSNPIYWPNKAVGKIYGNISYNGIRNISIDGSTYNNLKWFSCFIGQSPNTDFLKYNTDFYFAPKIGIVRKVEFGTPTGTRVWLLKRKSIVL